MFKILMIMNALTEFITQQELQKLTKTSQRLDFKDIKFPVKIGDIHKIEKTKNTISIGVFGYQEYVLL